MVKQAFKTVVGGAFVSLFIIGCAATEPVPNTERQQAEAESSQATDGERTHDPQANTETVPSEDATSSATAVTDNTTTDDIGEPALTRDNLDAIPEAWTQEHQELRQQLTEMGRASRASNANYCVIEPLGHSPCGGPAGYLVYSRENKSADELADIERDLTRYNELDRIINTQRQVAGICRYNEAPRVALYQNRCVPQLGRQR